MSRRDGGLLPRLAAAQVARPWWFLLLAVVITVPALLAARLLALRTGFESLLPENKASVQELKRVSARTVGVSTFMIVIDAPDRSKGVGNGSVRRRFQ